MLGIIAVVIYGINSCVSDDPDAPARPTPVQPQQSGDSVTGPLDRPTSFRIAKTRTTLHLNWSHSGGASIYRVRSGTIDETTSSRSLKITNLRAGATYEFRVRAESGNRQSVWTVVRASTLPPPDLPDYVTVRLNERYDEISVSLPERVMAEVVDWYQHQYALVAKTPSVIHIEPLCSSLFGEVLGFARRVTNDAGEPLIEVCVRLDEDSDSAIESADFKWLLAHEYFHVLQANAGWAFEDPTSVLGNTGDCGRHLTEGSAEYFGQMYAWGELHGGGILDLLESLFALDAERWYYYEDGARAFEALIGWKGRHAATQFWESDEENCAYAFLAAFDVAPGKFETDWQELTGQ